MILNLDSRDQTWRRQGFITSRRHGRYILNLEYQDRDTRFSGYSDQVSMFDLDSRCIWKYWGKAIFLTLRYPEVEILWWSLRSKNNQLAFSASCCFSMIRITHARRIEIDLKHQCGDGRSHFWTDFRKWSILGPFKIDLPVCINGWLVLSPFTSVASS